MNDKRALTIILDEIKKIKLTPELIEIAEKIDKNSIEFQYWLPGFEEEDVSLDFPKGISIEWTRDTFLKHADRKIELNVEYSDFPYHYIKEEENLAEIVYSMLFFIKKLAMNNESYKDPAILFYLLPNDDEISLELLKLSEDQTDIIHKIKKLNEQCVEIILDSIMGVYNARVSETSVEYFYYDAVDIFIANAYAYWLNLLEPNNSSKILVVFNKFLTQFLSTKLITKRNYSDYLKSKFRYLIYSEKDFQKFRSIKK